MGEWGEGRREQKREEGEKRRPEMRLLFAGYSIETL